jgi:hypothetical protein
MKSGNCGRAALLEDADDESMMTSSSMLSLLLLLLCCGECGLGERERERDRERRCCRSAAGAALLGAALFDARAGTALFDITRAASIGAGRAKCSERTKETNTNEYDERMK